MWCRGGSRSALTRIALQFGDHDHLYARFDLAVDLDGLFEPDTASVEADTAGPLDCVGDVGRCNRTEKTLVLARSGFYGDHALVEDAGDLLRPLGQTPVPLFR